MARECGGTVGRVLGNIDPRRSAYLPDRRLDDAFRPSLRDRVAAGGGRDRARELA